MNNLRRKRILKVAEQLDDLNRELDELQQEEQDAFDNLPESLQYSEKGETMEEHISEIQDVIGEVDDIKERLTLITE